MTTWTVKAASRLHRWTRRSKRTDRSGEDRSCATKPKDPKTGIILGQPEAGEEPAQHSIPTENFLSQHIHCVGGTGVGKTAWALGLVHQLLQHRRAGIVLIDAKGDLSSTMLEMLITLASESDDQKAFLSNVRVFNPFAKDSFVPWNLCARIESVSSDVQAYELSSLILEAVQAEAGIRQKRLLHNLLALTISQAGTLMDAHRVLTSPPYLARMLAKEADPRLRRYFFAEFLKEPPVTRAGVVARLDAITRLESWRAMFGCNEGLDFQDFFNSGVTLINIGDAPLGCRDLQSFIGRLIFLRLARAVMNRPVMTGSPVMILIDEVQEFVSSEVAEEMERLLALARSRKVALALFHQQVGQLAKVSPLLPKVLRTNCGIQAVFRSNRDDAKHFEHLLPTTGRALRSDFRPDQRSSRSPYLSSSEERAGLVDVITDLPNRRFYLWNAGGGPARLLQTPNVPFECWSNAAQQHPDLYQRIMTGALAKPYSALENEATGRQRPEIIEDDLLAETTYVDDDPHGLGEVG